MKLINIFIHNFKVLKERVSINVEIEHYKNDETKKDYLEYLKNELSKFQYKKINEMNNKEK